MLYIYFEMISIATPAAARKEARDTSYAQALMLAI
jgi:hypothetical protein